MNLYQFFYNLGCIHHILQLEAENQFLRERLRIQTGEIYDLEWYIDQTQADLRDAEGDIADLELITSAYSRELIQFDQSQREWQLAAEHNQRTILTLEAQLEQYAIYRPTHPIFN